MLPKEGKEKKEKNRNGALVLYLVDNLLFDHLCCKKRPRAQLMCTSHVYLMYTLPLVSTSHVRKMYIAHANRRLTAKQQKSTPLLNVVCSKQHCLPTVPMVLADCYG